MSGSLEGRGAVVTGGGRGIGAATARALAAEGAAVVVASRTSSEVAEVADTIVKTGCAAWGVTCDVTDPVSVDGLVDAAEERMSKVDIVVNNAGIAHSAPLPRTTLDDWRRTLDVNATGTFLVTRAFFPAMMERGWGRVVNVASVAGLAGDRYISAYAASKHAVIGFTRSVAAEAEGTGVTVNAVCPAFVNTRITRESVVRVAEITGRTEDEVLTGILAAYQQTRLLTPDEVARAIVGLCGDQDRNGEAVLLDGSEAT